MSVTWIIPVEYVPGGANSWQDMDVSASVPAGATGVILHYVNPSGYSQSFGLRKNGSTDNRTTVLYSHGNGWAVIGVDANRVFEAYVGSITDVDIYVVGYFESADASFFTNAVDHSLGSTGSYIDIDISADTGTDTAIGAFFEVVGVFSGRLALRKNGSTDDPYYYASTNCHAWFAVGVDGSEICEGKVTNTSIGIFLVGYQIANATFLTNATDLSLATVDAWTDLSALPAGATGGYFLVTGGLNRRYFGLRKNGSAEDIYQGVLSYSNGAFVECDASQIIEGKIDNTDCDFYLIGYTAAAGGETVTADAGVCSIAGADVALKATRKVSAESAGLAISGSDVTLNRGYRLSTDPDSLSIYGDAASLKCARKLLASPGLASMSGWFVYLRAIRTVPTESGAIGLSGQSADLLTTRLLSAEHGTCPLSAPDATLTYGNVTSLSCDAGSIAISGQSVGLNAVRRITADTGTLTVTGQDATLTYAKNADYSLTAEAGSLSISGADAALRAQRSLVCDPDSLPIAGGFVGLIYEVGRLSADSGALSISGGSAGLLAGRKVSAAGGSLSVSGSDISLQQALALSADPGDYNFSGAAASLLSGRKISASSGTAAISGQDATLTYTETVSAARQTYTARARTFSYTARARTFNYTARS